MDILLREPTPILTWDSLTSDQQAHMDKDFPCVSQSDRFFFKNPIPCDFVLPADLFFGPVDMTIGGVDYDLILTLGGVVYLVENIDNKLYISLAIV